MAQSSPVMRLFADDGESPVIPMAPESPAWKDSDLEQVMTPFGKSCTFGTGSNFTMFSKNDEDSVIRKYNDVLFIDEDSGLGMENETENDGFQLSAISSFLDTEHSSQLNDSFTEGAVNMYTKDEVHNLLQLTEADRPRVLVFHCEFSSERGPKMYRFLRCCDRELNKECYPRLNLPEIYVLEGGYKEFFTHYPSLCDPSEYKPMLHKDHTSDLRHFRVKSKSWAGGQHGKQLSKSRRSRSCLSLKYSVS